MTNTPNLDPAKELLSDCTLEELRQSFDKWTEAMHQNATSGDLNHAEFLHYYIKDMYQDLHRTMATLQGVLHRLTEPKSIKRSLGRE